MSTNFTRRSLIKTMAGTVAAGMLDRSAFAQLQQNGSRLAGRENGELHRLVTACKRQFRVLGSSVAISRNSQFVYDRGLGVADRKDSLPVTTSNLFRASLSKPITAVAIFTLVEFDRDDGGTSQNTISQPCKTSCAAEGN